MGTTQAPIIVEQSFSASIHQVWDALTNPAQMQQWYFPQLEAFEPAVGFETSFLVEVEHRKFPHQWKVTEAAPVNVLAYEWTFEGYEGQGTSRFELHEADGQTYLTLTYTVQESFPDNIPEFKRESGVAGWNYLLTESLKAFLATQNTR